MVTIDDANLVSLLAWVTESLEPGDFISAMPTWRYRQLFAWACRSLGLESVGFRPYSLRRGGATEDFRAHGQLDRSLIRGRWGNSSTARIYITDGLARYTALNFSQLQRALLGRWNFGKVLAEELASKG